MNRAGARAGIKDATRLPSIPQVLRGQGQHRARVRVSGAKAGALNRNATRLPSIPQVLRESGDRDEHGKVKGSEK